MITLLAHMRLCGGRQQAEAVGSRESTDACTHGHNNSNAL